MVRKWILIENIRIIEMMKMPPRENSILSECYRKSIIFMINNQNSLFLTLIFSNTKDIF